MSETRPTLASRIATYAIAALVVLIAAAAMSAWIIWMKSMQTHPEPAPTVTHAIPAVDPACAEAAEQLDALLLRMADEVAGPVMFEGVPYDDPAVRKALSEITYDHQAVYFDAIRRCDGLEPVAFEGGE